jgi:hypothetical protein
MFFTTETTEDTEKTFDYEMLDKIFGHRVSWGKPYPLHLTSSSGRRISLKSAD